MVEFKTERLVERRDDVEILEVTKLVMEELVEFNNPVEIFAILEELKVDKPLINKELEVILVKIALVKVLEVQDKF
jgi:hypothetical protein